MKKLLTLALVGLMTGCGSLTTLTTIETGYYSGTTCVRGEYAYGIYGFGYYDCWGRLIYLGAYDPYRFNTNAYGPTIIVTKERVSVPSSTRRGATSSGSSRSDASETRTQRTGGTTTVGRRHQ